MEESLVIFFVDVEVGRQFVGYVILFGCLVLGYKVGLI